MTRRLASFVLIAFSALAILGPARDCVGGGMGSYRRTEVIRSGEAGPPQTIIPAKEDDNVRRTAGALDQLRKKVEEWGAVTISAPVAVLDSRAFVVP
jgi:hypothetical protein